MKILNFGSLNMDFVYSLDHIVSPGETLTSRGFDTFPGGKGLNQSIAAARGGAKIFHAGCIGTDGELLKDILDKSGADTSYIKKAECKNGHAIIQVDAAGQNSIFVFPGANEAVSKEYVDRVLKDFEKDDIILLQNEISNVDYITDLAYRKEMCIIFNPSPYNEKIDKIDFNKLSYIILNEVEAKEVSGEDDPRESIECILKKYPNLKVLMTLGSKGCVYADKGIRVSQSAFEVETVDTTAAGDTFTGYFVAELAKGTMIEEALKIASAASAVAVSKEGAEPSIPQRDEILEALGWLKEKDNEQ